MNDAAASRRELLGPRRPSTSNTPTIRHGVVAKIDQHSHRLLLVRAACVAEDNLALGSMSLGTVSRLS